MKPVFAVLGAVILAAQVNATDLANRLFVEADAGGVWRGLDGPLLGRAGTTAGAQVSFRGDSWRVQPYGAVLVGVRVNDWLSFRAGYQDFGNTEVKVQGPGGFDPNYTFPTDFRSRDTAFTFDPVLTWRVSPQVKFQGYWGMAFERTDTKTQNFKVLYFAFPTQTAAAPVGSAPVSTAFDSGIYDGRTLSQHARAGIGVAISLTDRLDLNLGLDHQGLSSFAKEAWMAHVGMTYVLDTPRFLLGRVYVTASAGELWRRLDGPLLKQPGIYPGGTSAYQNGSSKQSSYGAVKLGVQATDWLAVEVGYQDFGTTYVFLREPLGFVSIPESHWPQDFRSRDWAFTLDPVLTWKAGPRLSLYGSWGVAFNRADVVCEDRYFPYAFEIGSPVNVRYGFPATSSHTAQSRLGVGAVAKIMPGLELRVGGEYQEFSSFSAAGWMTHVGIVLGF
jgi:hypothetical protein